jgi:hypothetical protein
VASKSIVIHTDDTLTFVSSGYVSGDCNADGMASDTLLVLPGKPAAITLSDCDWAPGLNSGDRIKGTVTIVSNYEGSTIDTTTTGSISAKLAP